MKFELPIYAIHERQKLLPVNVQPPYILVHWKYISPPAGLDPLEDGIWFMEKAEVITNDNAVFTLRIDSQNNESDEGLRKLAEPYVWGY